MAGAGGRRLQWPLGAGNCSSHVVLGGEETTASTSRLLLCPRWNLGFRPSLGHYWAYRASENILREYGCLGELLALVLCDLGC